MDPVQQCLDQQLQWQDPEQHEEEVAAWAARATAWIATCAEVAGAGDEIKEQPAPVGIASILGKRQVDTRSAVAVGVLKKAAVAGKSLAQLGPWDRHKLLLQQRMPSGAALASLVPKSDADFLREHHEFIRGDGGAAAADSTWGERLAAHYYSKLLKEYALCDLSRYKEGKVGLRWRVPEEVVAGKGQFTCAALACGRAHGLQSYELPFSYQEKGENKQALVKVRVCSKCATKLYWNKQHELDKLRALVRHAHKDKRSRSHSRERNCSGRSKERKHKRHRRARSNEQRDGGDADLAHDARHGGHAADAHDAASPDAANISATADDPEQQKRVQHTDGGDIEKLLDEMLA